MKKILTLILICFIFSANAQTGMLNGTGYAPDISVSDINGNTHNLYSYLNSDKVVVLELMSTTCWHCQQYAAGTENSYQAYGPNGLDVAEFIALEVNTATSDNDLANFATTYGVSFPMCNGISPTAINYQLYYTPSYYVIYPDSSYVTFCPAYCQTTSSFSTIENLLNTAIQTWLPPVYGCTDPLATNYDSTATNDDGSCDYTSFTIITIGSTFSPDTIICDVGDTINFILGGYHNAVEVSNGTWLSGGTTSNSGFSFGYGATGQFIPTNAQTYYYVCQPHVTSGMKGVIIANALPISGCTDFTATNYDPAATVDDGSCAYAMCATVYPFSEDFETGSSAYLTMYTGGNAGSSIDSNNNVTATSQYTWHGQGGTFAGWNAPYNTGELAFTNSPTHVATGSICVDLTSFAVGSAVALSFDLRQEYSYHNSYSWFRVKSDTSVLSSIAGNDYYQPTTPCGDTWVNHTYDLSAYVGTSINIDFQSCGKYEPGFGCTDNSFVDNVSIVSAIYGCMDALATNYNSAATASDGSCIYPCHSATGYATGFEDGLAQLALNPADWMQNSDDNVGGHGTYGDWIHDNLGTGSSNTGPNYATNSGGTGNAMEGAYYMFIEASGNYNNNVSMTSHCFDLSTLSNASLKFWYNMYGSGMGSLDVELSSDGGMTWDSTWTVSGDQGTDWAEASIDVSAYAATGVTVKITGTTGSTYYSDICIDAMSLVDGAQVYGCTDSIAWNYDAAATIDDGSCQYPCTDNEVTFEMMDSYGDGWNGNTYDVSIGGVSVATGGLTSGYFGTDTLCLPAGCYDVTVGGGSYPSEVSFNFASLVGAATGTYTGISVGGAACGSILGCTDSTAMNYNANATQDDGSCVYPPTSCTNPSPTGAYTSELIHDRARVNWDNMNDANCMVDQYRIRYREIGSSSWSSKTMSGSGLCMFGLNTTSKKILGLTASTTYEYYMKAWYCGGGVSGWSAIQNFTTLDLCPNVINFAVSTPTNTKASFTWDTISAYSFARIKLRPDVTGGVWTTAGGFGVFYPALTKPKNGLTPGQAYRASARTWCDPSGGAYRSDAWTSPIFWTQPNAIRVEGGTVINNLAIYPNPSRDIFNVSFTSDTKQDLRVRIMNVIGEEVINDNLEQFIGEYTKQINLSDNAKGIYFLEIKTNDGIINKKLILQ